MPPRFALGLGNESGDFAMHIPAILGILAGIGILIIELWGALSSFVFFAGAHFFVAVGILLIIELMPAPTFFGLLVGISIIVVEVSKLGA
jgi:hypothetical protein